MKIKRLEIAGFKSFVDKTVFDFQQGVTAIVGPNGCGKSNVVDAMRWAMGEQSARNLRGRQMEDVIFGGSESRRPVGMAEVSLVFSTEDGRVPGKYLAFSEIQVTRRLYRDGESEYLLNRTPCRLMDISELFMDTGIGAKAYSVIEQGRIGMILHSKPEERRFLIEEAAGVTKYKVRKQVALKKIDITRQNLLRLADIIGEIKRQLASLQRQAKKAESFRLVRDEIRGLEAAVAGVELRRTAEETVALKASLKALEDQTARIAADLARGELSLEQNRCLQLEQEQQLTAMQEACYQLRADIQGDENRLELLRREIESLDKQAERAAAECSAIEAFREQGLSEQNGLKEMEAETAIELALIAEELSRCEKELAALSSEEVLASQNLEARKGELFSLLAATAEAANRRSTAAKRLDTLLEGQKRREREGETFTSRHTEALRMRDLVQQQLSQALAERDGKRASLEGMRLKAAEYQQRRDQLQATVYQTREQKASTGSRLASLRELEAQFAGFGQGVKTLLSAPDFRGRLGEVLADVLEADPSCELAVEAALADRVQYLLLPDRDEVFNAVSYLKEQSAGRCGFFADIPHIAPHEPPAGCTCLADLVTVKAPFAPQVRALLASTYLAEDLGTALKLAHAHPGASFVTREGDLVAGDGAIFAGSGEGAGAGIIHKKREIRELDRQLADLGRVLLKAESDLEACELQLARQSGMVASEEQEFHRIDLHVLTQEKDMARFREECERLEELQQLRVLEDGQLARELDELRLELDRDGQQEATLTAGKAPLEQGVEICARLLEEKRAQLAEARERVTVLKVRDAALGEKRQSLQQGMRRLEEQSVDIARREILCRKEMQDAGDGRVTLNARLEADRAAMVEKLERQQVQEGGLQRIKIACEELSGMIQEQEASLRQLRGQHELLLRQSAEGSLRQAELSLKREHLVAILEERNRITPEEAMAAACADDFSPETAQQRLEKLKRQLDDLGEVNLAALDDYRALEERHGFLVGQKNDLEESLHGLQKAISKINRTTRQRFMETFTLVNERFREVFPRLFCGGSAELRLTNEDDLLETGIDIIVQPPGKKLQNVSLLSGGEKALTAVALIFSIFQIKPSPFCLLDEVDAPLDEANIGRFNDLVREMSRFSQFIMITHSKATMAVADTLYGITMEEPGASRVVSVCLNKGSGG
jgi:chromosome segregation protein